MSWFTKILQSIVDFVKKLSNSSTDNTTDSDNTDSSTDEPIVVGADEVPFQDLIWSYGGFKGGSSVINPDAVIKNLTFKGDTLYYGWAKGGCENFGATNAHDHSYTICAVFFKDSTGKYTGGKFDWISTDRLSRDGLKKQIIIKKVLEAIARKRGLENVHNGYSGWSTGTVPNPAEAAFVICGVSSPGGSSPSGKRTNVIKGVWSR